jgi:subtilisin family serine protease
MLRSLARCFADRPLVRLAIACGALLGLAVRAVASPPFREGRVLVGYVDGVARGRHARIASAVGATDLGAIGAHTRVLRVRPGREMATIHALRARRDVRYAEPDWIGHADALPDDPKFGRQWALRNTGAKVFGVAGVPGADEDAVPAWDVTTGSAAIVVGITDTGLDYGHPDLVANVWSNPGGINGCPAGTHGFNVLTGTCDPMDDDTAYNGHGTHVAGIIGAAGDNGVGVAGVGWSTTLLPVKWLDSHATGSTSSLISALDWLVRAKQAGVPVRVVNDSATFPGTAYSQALVDEIDVLAANDILLVTAAGNTAENNDDLATRRYPCGYMRANELCVAATDHTDALWTSSNYGVQTVNLAAPGYAIYSTLRGATYGYISGGSMAAAEVSGAAALVLSAADQPAETLRATILQAVDVLPSLAGLVATGGRLNVCNALPGCAATVSTTTTTTTRTTSTSTTTPPSTVSTSTTTSTTTTTAAPAPTTTTTTTVPSAGIALRQSNAAAGSSTPSVATAFPSANAAGSLLIAVVRMSTTSQTVAVTDSAGNVYREAVAQTQTADGHQLHILYAANVVGGPNTVTATFSSVNNRPWLAIYEYGGVRATDPLDQTARAQGSGATPSAGPTGPTSSANELVFAATGLPASYAGTVSAGAGYVLLRQETGGSRAASESGVAAAPGAYTATFALSAQTSWSAVVATFVGASSTTTTAGSTSTTTTTTAAPAPTTTTTTAPPAGIALRQSNAAPGSSTQSVTSAFASANAAGSLVIAVVRMSTTSQTVSVTDSAGNVYREAVAQAQTADGHQMHLFYAANVTGGPNTVTATFSSVNNRPWLAIYEYGGVRTTDPLDQTARAQGSSATPSSGPTGATTTANELVFAATGLPASYASTVSAGAGYVLQQQDTGGSRAATESGTAAVPGAYTATFGLGAPTNWTTVVATFAPVP